MTLSKKEETLSNLESALVAMKTSYHFAKGDNESLPVLQLKNGIAMIQAHWKEEM